MKHNRNHNNSQSVGVQLTPVRFEFIHPTATSVAIAGTFNDWHPEAKPMHPMGDGAWLKEAALAPGTYEYCLVVDGKYMPDPQARETVPNPFGGMNSILKVASPRPTGSGKKSSNGDVPHGEPHNVLLAPSRPILGT